MQKKMTEYHPDNIGFIEAMLKARYKWLFEVADYEEVKALPPGPDTPTISSRILSTNTYLITFYSKIPSVSKSVTTSKFLDILSLDIQKKRFSVVPIDYPALNYTYVFITVLDD